MAIWSSYSEVELVDLAKLARSMNELSASIETKVNITSLKLCMGLHRIPLSLILAVSKINRDYPSPAKLCKELGIAVVRYSNQPRDRRLTTQFWNRYMSQKAGFQIRLEDGEGEPTHVMIDSPWTRRQTIGSGSPQWLEFVSIKRVDPDR